MFNLINCVFGFIVARYNAIIFCWNQLVHIFLEDFALTQLYLLTQYCISLFRRVGLGLNTNINNKRSALSYP